MFTVSITFAWLVFFLYFCTDVVMRYMFPHAWLSKTDGKHSYFSIFISRGYCGITIIYIQKGKVRGTEEMSRAEQGNGVL